MRNSNSCLEGAIHIRPARRWWLLVALVVICLAKPSFALDPNRALSQYVRDKWGAERGFLGGTVYAISQSSDGYLWIGTERGLVRFDGYTFALIQRPLPDSADIGPVRGLLSDADGNLWIRLEGPRMLLYRHGRFEDVYNRLDLQDVTFTAMVLDNQGRVLLSGLGDRTLRYRDGRLETVVGVEEQPGIVSSLATTRDGRIWLGTQENGLFRTGDGQVSKVVDQSDDAKISSLVPANNGGLWIGTDRGLHFWDGSSVAEVRLPWPQAQVQILAMSKDRDGNLWAGTNFGLARISPSRSVSVDQLTADPTNRVTAIYEDRDGALWLGTSKGIERLLDGMFATYSTAQGLPSDNNGPVYVDSESRTWFAPLTGGLYWLKDGKIASVTSDGLDRDIVYSISGGDGEVWVGRQRGGLTRLKPNGESFSAITFTKADGLAQDSVYSVHRNRDGTVWAGTVSAGVSRLDGGKFTNFSEANGLPSNTVNSIIEGSDGTMWFATPGGLVSFAHGQWTNLSGREGLPSPNVRTIFEDARGVLWIATNGGLAYLSSGHVNLPPKLPEALREEIFGIAEDDVGSLWFSTSDHVIQVNRERLLGGSLQETDLQSYGMRDGLLGVEGVGRDRTIVSDPTGRIWASLNRGLSVADPRSAVKSSAPVAVRIESMDAGREPIDIEKQPRLRAGIANIVFNYGSTNLAAPERIRFRYKLDGADRDWSDIVASRQVTYTNLGPGSYVFRVVASNSEGLWNGPETAVPFVIEPAFWQSWWFRSLCVAACLLIIVALYRLRMYQLTKRLNDRFQERLAERTRIAQELHDTLLQGVLSASLQLDVAEDQLPEDSPAKPLLKRVLQLMAKVTEEGRNALRGLRTTEAENRSLELAFSRVRQEYGLNEQISYRVITNNVARPLRPLIRDEVYRIGREALANAFLHAEANSIEVEVEYASRYLRVLVRDDGRGIDAHVLHSGREGHWGLSGMRERSEGIGASLKLRSRIGAGTEVELTVPSTIAFENDSRGPISQWVPWLSREKFENYGTSQKKRAGH